MAQQRKKQDNAVEGVVKEAHKDVRNGLKGLKIVLFEEHNFRIEIIAAFLVLAASVWLKLSLTEIAILVGIIVVVISLEIINSSLEKLLKSYSILKDEPRLIDVKDMAAGAVLISVIGSLVIGTLIFTPHILKMFG